MKPPSREALRRLKLWEIFRFEISYQSRRVSTWLYSAVLLLLIFNMTGDISSDYARTDGLFSNDPFFIVSMTLLGSMMGLLIATALAGDAAARDAETGMDPLLYTTPVPKAAHLAGRFLAAFGLYAVILLAVPLGLVLSALVANRDLVGPFRPAAYLGPYLFLLLPNAFIATALLFSMAALCRRAIVSYFGAVLLFGAFVFSWAFVARTLGRWELAKLLDPTGATVLAELSRIWTPAEKSTRLIELQGSLLSNRVLWIGMALGVLTLTHLRFRLAHHTSGGWWSRVAQVSPSVGSGFSRTLTNPPEGGSHESPTTVNTPSGHAIVPVPRPASPSVGSGFSRTLTAPHVQRTFGLATHARQTIAVARDSFLAIVTTWTGLALMAGLAALVVANGTQIGHLGVPMFATAERMTALQGHPLIVMLLIVFYAGELVWREREARLSEMSDAAPVPEWASFLGKFVGLSLVLVAVQALLVGAGMLTQVLMDYDDFQIELYGRVLFGLQLPDYLLFALLALVVHAMVNHKYVGHMVVLIAYAFMVFASVFEIEHDLLVYGSDPGWTYSDMRGFEPFIAAWLWFKLYWAAWALLLTVAATLLWVRGKEVGLRSRLELARRRFTRSTAVVASAAVALVLTVGGFIFYNTNVLNAYHTASDLAERRAEYERRYGKYQGVPQPQLMGANLRVEIYPKRRKAEIRGTFTLVNRNALPIESIHVATVSAVEVVAMDFDRPASVTVADDALGHRIYALETALQPGESLRLRFEVRFEPRGFTNRGIDASVVDNGTYFTNQQWLPALGYQAIRELRSAGERRAHGLAERTAVAVLDDVEAPLDGERAARIAFEAVVGTDEGQVAVAPGRLRRTWTEQGRRYFHYATDAAIRNDYAFFSGVYTVHDARWHDVSIQIVHHPNHAWNVDRMVRSVQASLDYFTRQFGPYPHGAIRLVEHPGDGVSLHASPINISYEEGFALLNPEADARNMDLPFAVVAHEVAHQWWGNMLTPARVEGAAILTETLAWYSALGVVEHAFGREHVRRLLNMMREIYLSPLTYGNVPLLRADDWFLAYRKGPFAMYALREYVGAERVNAALRRLLEKHRSGTPPLPISLDLYRELQAVTPESIHSLLVDLFEANTFWRLTAHRVTAEHIETGAWQVTLDVRARKVVVDRNGVETDVAMNDLIEVGVFAGAEGPNLGEALYLEMHRVRSGEQRITVTVPRQPSRAGIDPRNLLIDVDAADNLEEITLAEDRSPHSGDRDRFDTELTYDAFYLRPTNGRADDQERRNRSTQYISHPQWPWARLRKETPAKYESYVDLVPGDWTKVKIDVRGSVARLYVHDNAQPTLIVSDVKTGARGTGAVALWLDTGTVAHFRNLTVNITPNK